MACGITSNRIAPAAYEDLKCLLDAVKRSGALADPEKFTAALPPKVQTFLASARFGENWKRILANTPSAQEARERAFHRWFDGLKTLRLLHRLSGGGDGD